VLPELPPIVAAALVLTPYGLVFFAAAFGLRIPEASTTLARARFRQR
jgi:hypothetical protein